MNTYTQVVAALERRDISAAAQLIKQWQQQSPKDFWLILACARYWEATRRSQKAEKAYRKVLQKGPPRLFAQAREGLQRLEAERAHQQQQALASAQAQPGAENPALLLLEPVAGEVRQRAIQGIARAVNLDLYTARMLLPGKHWRLYRVGAAGKLQVLYQQLQLQGVPAFYCPLAEAIERPVFQVQHVSRQQPQLRVVCKNSSGQIGQIDFTLAEVSQQVPGRLPIFESVVDIGPWGKLQRKEQTQDYAEVLDLHLHGRGCILRFCDRTYQYRQGMALTSQLQAASPTATQLWQQLKQILHAPASRQSDFTSFGETALEYLGLLPEFPHQLEFNRREPSPWDAAFHLYSGLRYQQHQNKILP